MWLTSVSCELMRIRNDTLLIQVPKVCVNIVYPDFVIFQQPFSSMELYDSPQLQSAFVLSGLPCHFQMVKEKENSHAQAYAPNGAMGLK